MLAGSQFTGSSWPCKHLLPNTAGLKISTPIKWIQYSNQWLHIWLQVGFKVLPFFLTHIVPLEASPPFERPLGPQQTPPLVVRAAMERALACTCGLTDPSFKTAEIFFTKTKQFAVFPCLSMSFWRYTRVITQCHHCDNSNILWLNDDHHPTCPNPSLCDASEIHRATVTTKTTVTPAFAQSGRQVDHCEGIVIGHHLWSWQSVWRMNSLNMLDYFILFWNTSHLEQ